MLGKLCAECLGKYVRYTFLRRSGDSGTASDLLRLYRNYCAKELFLYCFFRYCIT